MSRIDKTALSERDICTKYITPAIVKAGWDLETDLREEVLITAGAVLTQGKHHVRAKPKRADYILNYKNIRLAIVEAKNNNRTVGHGMQQALEYAEALQVPFVFTSNGDAFMFHDRTATTGPIERELSLDEFPSPETLLRKYQAHVGLTEEGLGLVTQDYYTSGKEPHYYQVNAIQRTLEAIAKGQRRILLVMATGTGKTFTAFQIIWRLWKAKTKPTYRILFLADRNILVDQAKSNDFTPFAGAMTKITNRQIDKSYEIYLSLYQAVTGSEEADDIYKQFSREFFDLVVIDECHRGSAAEDSAWRAILDYFASAIHIGLTATPNETNNANRDYFGDPVYTYSLKQGIEDGFLAPYKVVRIDLDKDAGWRPEQGQRDVHGREIEDRVYTLDDMDKSLVLEARNVAVAAKITEFLRGTDPFAKTIVFCDDIPHAERMRRALVNANPEFVRLDSRYVMRITGDEHVGKRELSSFIDPESRFPVLVTTSRLLNTGVDVRTCKLIVIDRHIESMTEFKQIIGRGTRIYEDPGNETCPAKLSFTIMDFKRATELFADPAFDGPALTIHEAKQHDSPIPPEDREDAEPTPTATGPDHSHAGLDHLAPPDARPRSTPYVVADVAVFVASERTQYYDTSGKLITESPVDHARKRVLASYPSLELFLDAWRQAPKKATLVRELEATGLVFRGLAEELGLDLAPFDLIRHVVFGQAPITRRERAERVARRGELGARDEHAAKVLGALLDKFAEGGIDDFEDLEVLKVQPFSDMGSLLEIVRGFGGKPAYLAAVRGLESRVYSD
jgi:type I restriction enzyme R subunit